MTHHILVLGAGYAGLGAAKRAARLLASADVRVTLVNATDRFVERIRLHQLAAGQPLPDLPLADLLAGTGVDLVVATVTAVDPVARTVRIERSDMPPYDHPDTPPYDTPPYDLPYDTLIYALGSAAPTTAVPGLAAHALSVATYEDAVRLRERLAAPGAAAGSLTVVGGGLTGVETAAELAETHRGLRVRLVTDADLAPGVSERGRRHLRRGLDRLGVEIREHAPVSTVTEHGLVLADGARLPADTVVWAAGFQVPHVAREAGFAVDRYGRMAVDATQRSTSHPEVYAVGDAATAPAPGPASRMSCQAGLPMGVQVADAVAARLSGRDPRPLAVRYVSQCISLGRRDGLVQFVRADDSPVGAVLAGRKAAAVKEFICRFTVRVIRRPKPSAPRGPRPNQARTPAGAGL
ncbi:NAD(P)/FAD-dependent oxidoreductase [Streptomyces sp. XD-27]|uniref:NAD(P)/FAD-dependent oxidoreductase n=1 Tax=Streptomyces sp. XD-27 TaxID=3062779 RepID=UPI0026F41B26|nr:FAD-dependent oxidoreductase [Streptomyces sp. XD-27]WKX71883.1 FAD-dependent oxidoreductase [Streptomyces sp. XD-27]